MYEALGFAYLRFSLTNAMALGSVIRLKYMRYAHANAGALHSPLLDAISTPPFFDAFKFALLATWC